MKNNIVPIALKLVKKGVPKQFAIICLLQPDDIKVAPFEPEKEDKNQMIRKETRRAHKDLLKKLKKARKRLKEKGKV